MKKLPSSKAPSCAVDKFIGTDFDHVVNVSSNIEAIKELDAIKDSVGTVASNIEAVKTVATNIGDVNTVSDNMEYVKDVAAGIEGLPVVSYIGSAPPAQPTEGASWYCTTDGRTYVWYRDTDSYQWVESSPQSVAEDQILDATLITFKNEFGYSAVDNMILGRVHGNSKVIKHKRGNLYFTEGTTWKCLMDSATTLDGFCPVGGEVSITAFGAVGDGLTPSGSAIQAAMNYVSSLGGGVVTCPAGVYSIELKLIPASNITLRGEGWGATKFTIPKGDSLKNSIFYHVNELVKFKNFTITGIDFVGCWEDYPSEIYDNGLITLKWVTNLTVKNCGLHYSRGFAFNINSCDTVLIEGNTLEYAVRDMIAVWNTPDVRIINNILRYNDDDGISISSEQLVLEPVRSRAIVTGNILEDTGPIRTQCPKNILISNNILSRSRGAGIFVGVINFSKVGVSSGHGVTVANNTITDVMDRQWFVDGTQTGSVNNRIYIRVESIPLQAGELPVPAGEINPTTGTVESPYSFYYKYADLVSGVGTVRSPSGVLVLNNICKLTLPQVTAYSDWGFGKAYGKNGPLNYSVPTSLLRGIALRVQLPMADMQISGNLLQAGAEGIQFVLATGQVSKDRLAKNISITNNSIHDFSLHGIHWNITGNLTHQDISIHNNFIDGDPFFTSPNRTSGGGWLAADSAPRALQVSYLGGITVIGNKFKNCASLYVQTGASNFQYYEGNFLEANAESTGFSVNNKGIGVIPPISDGKQWWLQYVDSDPTSSTYGNSLGVNLKNRAGLPTTGKYIAGTIISNRPSGPSGIVGSQYFVVGYFRKTTGTGHVLGTDWIEIRSPSGT